MKSIIIYFKDSYYRFVEVPKKHTYLFEDGDLVICDRNSFTGEETTVARFRNWDYFLMEEE